MKREFFTGCLAALLVSACSPQAPEALLPVPEPRQVEWQKMETYAFIHFGPNTFSDREWGYGDTNPALFDPAALDCQQWVLTLKQAGMKGVIFTAKHHDGFCLWPFEGTDYNVSASPWRGGRGNLVKELAEACRQHDMKLALYLSPWDRHHPEYGRPEYVEYYYRQLEDILSNYGPLFEIWFDGANGGDGWYGGACERRSIDRKTYYGLERAYEMVEQLQPQAVIFSDGGPGCRWVGNERGIAGETNWSFLRRGVIYPGYDKKAELQCGHPDGDQWVAAECDVSIRPGWFYHASQDDRVKSPEQLADLYYRSVGRNATLLLNFPVDRNGLIHPTDSANAVRFREIIERDLERNLVEGLRAEVSTSRGGRFGARALTDGNYDTFWATPDGVSEGCITFRLPQRERVNRVMLQEYIPLGQRVDSFVVEYLSDGEWLPAECGEATTTVGYKRLLRFPGVETDGVRVRFTKARGPLCINNVGVYSAPEKTDNL